VLRGDDAGGRFGYRFYYPPMRAGPYPAGTTPDEVFFRTTAGFNAEGRSQYENSQAPWQTDQLNEAFIIGKKGHAGSPLGDPVPFSAYLIGRLVNDTGYQTQFNLDADRAYGYLTWDWIRRDDNPPQGRTDMNFPYQLPVIAPWKADGWIASKPMRLDYVDPPPGVVIEERPPGGETPGTAQESDSPGGGS